MDLKEFALFGNVGSDSNSCRAHSDPEFNSKSKGCRHPWEIARKAIVIDLLKKIEIKSDLKVLDVGCGDLYVATAVMASTRNENKNRVSDYCAVDSAFNEKNKSLIQVGLSSIAELKNIKVTLFSNLNDKEVKADRNLCLLLDVVEHVPDDSMFLDSMLGKMVSGSCCLITVPAYQGLFTKHDTLLGHFRRYSPAQIQQLVQKKAEILAAGSFFFSLLLVRFLAALKEKVTSKQVSADNVSESQPNPESFGVSNWQGGPFITHFIAKMLWIDYKLCSWLHLPGLSTYVLIRKS